MGNCTIYLHPAHIKVTQIHFSTQCLMAEVRKEDYTAEVNTNEGRDHPAGIACYKCKCSLNAGLKSMSKTTLHNH